MSNFKVLRKLLMSSGSLVINKQLAHALGLEAAIMYSELLSKIDYFDERGELTEDREFFNTIEDMEKDTTLSEYQQKKAIKILQDLNLIRVKVKGLPARRYFWINEDYDFVMSVIRNKFPNIQKLESENLGANNTNINNTKYIYKGSKKSSPYQPKISSIMETKTAEFKEAFSEFRDMRVKIKKPMTDGAVYRMLQRLDKLAKDQDKQIQILLQSVDRNWQDVYELQKPEKETKSIYHDLNNF